ncbi:flagellar hook-associated protein FlgK [Litorivicinus sp.]|nr:flagellar hook-associated protein FlgK [Litorivicinus sp.]
MADLLAIGSSGINVYQRALATVSNNIANLNTDGYSRQTTEIRQNQPKEAGGGYIGTGAYFDRVSRQYDGFLESSLQQATADLESQGAAVEYTGRLLDILGDEQIGLTGALNKFFASAKSLSTDPASTALRGAMLRESDALVSRFQSLSGQLKDLGDQSLSALEANVRSANAIAGQLAEINRQMLKKSTESDQAPELLDRRDQLLRDLSEYVQITAAFDQKGSVTVSLTASPTKGMMVSGTRSSSLSVSPNMADRSRLEYRLQGELPSETLTGIRSGSVSGYANFFENTLVSVTQKLNQLAEVLVEEVNTIQTTGLNASGNLGSAFFEVVPSFDIDRGASSGDFQVEVSVTDSETYKSRPITVAFDGQQDLWYAKDETGAPVFADSSGLVDISGVRVRVTGTSNVGDQFTLTPDTGAARGLRLALQDGDEIATASLFRVTTSQKNNGVTDPRVSFSHPSPIDTASVSLAALSTGRPVRVEASSVEPLTVVNAGKSSVNLKLDPGTGSNISVQMITTDGRHILGHVGNVEQRIAMVENLPQFAPNATYNSDYLNQSGADAYKDLDVFYGARSEASAVTQLKPISSLFFEAPSGTDFSGGGLDLTLEPVSPNDRLGLENSPFADPTLGEVTAVNDIIYLGDGTTTMVLGTLESTYDGDAQTLRILFSDDIPAGVLTDELAARVASLVTFSNGEDLVGSSNPVKKRLTAELFDQDRSLNLVQGRDFVTSTLVEAGQVVTNSSQYIAKLATGNLGYASGAGRVLIERGDLTLNGVTLGELVINSSGILSATDAMGWINSANTGVGVTAANLIEIPSETLRLDTGIGLEINGVEIQSLALGSTLRFDDEDDLVASINAVSVSSGVFARRKENGDLLLQNINEGGDNIIIDGSLAGAGQNSLGIASKAYIGSLTFELQSGDGQSIEFRLGDAGKPSDLNLLGMNTEIQLRGEIDEDILVFIGGNGDGTVQASSVDSSDPFSEGLRSRQFEFEFVADDRFRIRDLRSDTVLAERLYNGELSLTYQGIQIDLDAPAALGDTFVVDGNNLGPNGTFDGQGNNGNILRVVDLESDPVVDGALTISESYLKFVGDVGNEATQSAIARDALEIIQTQAIEARDRVSGVNLDKEAADLIRFQQAYQASAQVMQVATKLFDTVLQVR